MTLPITLAAAGAGLRTVGARLMLTRGVRKTAIYPLVGVAGLYD